MLPEALKAAEKAVRLSPNGATFLNNLTLLYFANKDYVNAEIMARRTMKAQDNILSCYTILFDILITQKRYLEAAELVPRLVKMGVKIPTAAMQLLQPYL
jgi:tetratricopeptide (TPR) repeat protein